MITGIGRLCLNCKVSSNYRKYNTISRGGPVKISYESPRSEANSDNYYEQDDYGLDTENTQKCPNCSSLNFEKKGFRKEKQRYICKDCGRNWTSDIISKKVSSSSREYISISSGRRVKNDDELSRSETNKLVSFTNNPLKYARGTSKSLDKVKYLESIKYKFSEGQLATFNTAREEYDNALVNQVQHPKKDFSKDLEQAFKEHRTVKIRYKGSWRSIDPYSLNNTYCVAYCHFARDIRTFRIDKIQGAELSDSFKFNDSLYDTAQLKLEEAPNFGRYK